MSDSASQKGPTKTGKAGRPRVHQGPIVRTTIYLTEAEKEELEALSLELTGKQNVSEGIRRAMVLLRSTMMGKASMILVTLHESVAAGVIHVAHHPATLQLVMIARHGSPF